MSGPPPSSPLFPYTPLSRSRRAARRHGAGVEVTRCHRGEREATRDRRGDRPRSGRVVAQLAVEVVPPTVRRAARRQGRKSTRLNSSHSQISYAVFCLKKKKT